MECPRCGGDVTVYRLGSNETVACDDCEYAGIPVEHGSEPQPSESWTAAIERFYDDHHTDEGTESEATDEDAGEGTEGEETLSDDGSAAAGVASAGSAVEAVDVPGDGVERARRRAAITSLYERLRSQERATSEELVQGIDAEAAGYESAARFWTLVGHDRLSQLPGVIAPAEDEEEWRFDVDWSEWRSGVRD